MSQAATAVPYFVTGNPETEEFVSLPAGFPSGMLGMECEFNQGTAAAPKWCRYQFFKCAASQTPLVGTVLYWVDKTAFTVTLDRTNRGDVAGVSQIAAAAAAEYIWILKKGQRSVRFQGTPTSAPDATGKPVVPSATADGVADSLALTTAPNVSLIGVTLVTAASNVALCRVNIPDSQ